MGTESKRWTSRVAPEQDAATRRVFALPGSAWAQLEQVLDRPPASKLALVKLLSNPSVLERSAG